MGRGTEYYEMEQPRQTRLPILGPPEESKSHLHKKLFRKSNNNSSHIHNYFPLVRIPFCTENTIPTFLWCMYGTTNLYVLLFLSILASSLFTTHTTPPISANAGSKGGKLPASRSRFAAHAPSPGAHLRLFWREKKVSEQEFRRPHHNHLPSINVYIERPDDGNVLIARRILGNQRAKIRWGLLTPSRRGVLIWLANP